MRGLRLHVLLDHHLIHICQQGLVRGLPLFRLDYFHPDSLATMLDRLLALTGHLLHGIPDHLHHLLSGIYRVFLQGCHTGQQVMGLDTL
ncbi:hypothetical protein KXW75_000287 [Aspergillus fumigatus]|nr:hypothetical protein KXW47_005333 [Aspergillus fumigatus]KAH2124008.1 hypothetical protein KXW75_000287 [Aspergillus fumigatus]KAH2238644.1 hypothetical protein KXW72_001991 [Aspergillus fumigatus]KAH2294344.1 hypothetical protein KXV50_002556 [Aspergillus fumigatus]